MITITLFFPPEREKKKTYILCRSSFITLSLTVLFQPSEIDSESGQTLSSSRKEKKVSLSSDKYPKGKKCCISKKTAEDERWRKHPEQLPKRLQNLTTTKKGTKKANEWLFSLVDDQVRSLKFYPKKFDEF